MANEAFLIVEALAKISKQLDELIEAKKRVVNVYVEGGEVSSLGSDLALALVGTIKNVKEDAK